MNEKNEMNEQTPTEQIHAENAQLKQTREDRVLYERMIFNQRFDSVMGKFGESCDENNIKLAVAIAVHPDEKEPLVFFRGDDLQAGRLTAYVLKRIKASIIAELNADI
jgi:hypothetical protein